MASSRATLTLRKKKKHDDQTGNNIARPYSFLSLQTPPTGNLSIDILKTSLLSTLSLSPVVHPPPRLDAPCCCSPMLSPSLLPLPCLPHSAWCNSPVLISLSACTSLPAGPAYPRGMRADAATRAACAACCCVCSGVVMMRWTEM